MRPLRFLLLAVLALQLVACGMLSPAQPTATPQPQVKAPLPTKPGIPASSAASTNPPVAKTSSSSVSVSVSAASQVSSASSPATKSSSMASSVASSLVSNIAVATLPDGGFGMRGDTASVTQKGGATGASSAATATKQTNMAFILDSSGSMTAKLPNSSQTKIQVAKQVMSDLVTQVPATVKASLWFYGHRYPQEPKAKSCTDIERLFPLGAVNATAYKQAIQNVNSIGYTPIADALIQAAKDLPAGDNQSNSIILVSDGEETCGGDPCKVAEALKASNSHVTIHVVGYDVDDATRKQLQCIANATGGQYRDASSADVLREAMSSAIKVADTKTFLRLEVAGPGNSQVKSKLSLYKAGTKEFVASMNGWADNPVAAGTYDVVIDTLPRVMYSNLSLPEGSATTIKLSVGAFEFASMGTESPNPYSVEVVDPATQTKFGQSLNPAPNPYYVLAGTFNLQLYPSVSQGTPTAVFSRVEIKPLAKITLQLGAFDLRGVNNDTVRPYSIKFYDAATNQVIASITGSSPKLYYLAPGTYRIELFYSITAYPQSTLNNVVIKPGETNTFTLGAYVLQDATGKAVHPDHTATDAASGQQVAGFSGYSPSRYYLPPGTYNLKFSNGEVKNVVLTSGKEITVQTPK